MKVIHSAVLTAAALALLAISISAYASDTDDRIESSARESYVFKTYLGDDDIKIQSEDGAVTLTGLVSEESHKGLAKETVASLPGVKSVDNQLELKDEPNAGNADALVSARVKLELLSHRNLSLTKTDVQVKDGVVTLSGEASSPAQRDLTTEYIGDVEGVKEVKNDMIVSETPKMPAEKTVAEKVGDVGKKVGDMASDVGKKAGVMAGDVGESIDDASVTALVKTTLFYHRSTSALNTKVETNEGVVTLSGTAKNAAAKDLATKFVTDVHGVKSVVNNMAVEGAEPKAN